MKNTIITLVLLVVFSNVFGQENNKFLDTKKYHLTTKDDIAIDDYIETSSVENQHIPITLYLKNIKGNTISEIVVSDIEFYSDTEITVLPVKGLNNIKEIIHLNSWYEACCSYSYSEYLMISENETVIELPILENIHCGAPEPRVDYVFPNQENGKVNKIIEVKLFLNEGYKTDFLAIEKIYYWDGKNIHLGKE